MSSKSTARAYTQTLPHGITGLHEVHTKQVLAQKR